MTHDCGGYMTPDIRGGHTCMKCGHITDEIAYYVADYDPNAWREKRLQHKRNKWFAKRLFGVVDYRFIDVLVYDFIQVVNQLADKGLIRRNVSKYGYYIIRLASRRGIPLKGYVNDVKPGKTGAVFDANFFGVCKDIDRSVYWVEWELGQIKDFCVKLGVMVG